MATFIDLITQIERELRQSINGNFRDDVKAAINDAIEFHSLTPFFFNEGIYDQVLTADVDAYVLAEYVLAVNDAEIKSSNGNFSPLYRRDFREYLRNKQSSSGPRVPGRGEYYSIYDKTFYLHTPPSTNETNVFIYFTRQIQPHPLEADDAENAWTKEARHLIKMRAKSYLYIHRAQQPDMAEAMVAQEPEHVARLTSQYARNRGGEGITPWWP